MSASSLQADLVVVGSGASGLTAAFTAASLGLDVVVVEKEPQLGGASAWSGGWMWIPCNPLAIEAVGLIVNQALVKRPPATWDEVFALDRALGRWRSWSQERKANFLRNQAMPEIVGPRRAWPRKLGDGIGCVSLAWNGPE